MTPYLREQPVLKKYYIVDTPKKLDDLARKMMKVSEFAFDTETGSWTNNRSTGLAVRGENDDLICVCITISWGDYNNYYIPLNHRREEDASRNLSEALVVKKLQPVFDREDVTVIGANLKFDLHVLNRIGFEFKTSMKQFDVLLAMWLVDENISGGLKGLSQYYFKYPQEHFSEIVNSVPSEVKREFGLKGSQKATYDLVAIEDGKNYALDDSFQTWNLYLYALDMLEVEGMADIFWKHSIPFSKCLYKMERRGMVIDVERLDEMGVEIEKDLKSLIYSMIEILGEEFNPSSNIQLAEILFGYIKDGKQPQFKSTFNFPVQSKTEKGAPQTNALTLYRLSRLTYKTKRKKEGIEFVNLLMEYKRLEKLKSAFIDGLREQIYKDGKVHPSFNQNGADSGRISMSYPNCQQMPRAEEDEKYKIRSLFIGDLDSQGRRKKIIAVDLSNLEIRVTAHFSQDEKLLEMFANGEDIHGATAVNMFELDCLPNEAKKKYPHLRQVAKILNFLLIYGGGAFTLYNNLLNDPVKPIDLGDEEHLAQYPEAKDGVEVAQIYIDKYFETYQGVAKFIRRQKMMAHKNGYIKTVLQRKRRLKDINSSDFKLKAYNERLAVNSTIQASAADITSSAQIRIDSDRWFEEHECLMLNQIHDEIVMECPEEYIEEAIKRVQHYFKYPFGDDIEFIPTLESEGDFGDSYANAK